MVGKKERDKEEETLLRVEVQHYGQLHRAPEEGMMFCVQKKARKENPTNRKMKGQEEEKRNKLQFFFQLTTNTTSTEEGKEMKKGTGKKSETGGSAPWIAPNGRAGQLVLSAERKKEMK